jgi:PAS domain S-box-containing protein
MASWSSNDIYAETLAVFDEGESRYEPLTTPEVAAALDVDRRTVYKRLRMLADDGALATKKTGAHSRVWWRPPDESSPGDTGGVPMPTVDGVAIVDEAGKYRYVNDPHVETYGYDDAAAFLGEDWRLCYDEAELTRFDEEIIPTLHAEGAWRGEATGQRKDGTTFPQDLSLTVVNDGGILCVVRDVTDHREHERRLRDARRFTEELVENAPFGMFRLDEELRITYENPRAEEIIGLPEDEAESDAMGVDISTLPPIVETGQADLFRRLPEGDTIEFAFPFESIYGKEAYFTGRAVPVYRDGEFDGAILMATDISERRQYERELERQREQLAALDELNDVVRGITEAVIEQSVREEIERVACERLAAADSYRFAWIGGVDAGPELEPRVAVGADGALDDPPRAPDPDGTAERGLAAEAIDTREIRVVQDALEAPDEAVRSHAREFEYRSAAAMPIVHQGVCYGVLGVYSGRPDAFAAAEREVVGQLGDVIGHAIAAVDRKRALMSDEVVELEIRGPDPFECHELSAAADGAITVERMMPLGDDEYLMYGTATGDAMAALDRRAESLPGWTAVRTFDETGAEVRFEARVADAPMVSAVVDHGGNFKSGRIEDGTYDVTVQLPPGTDVRRVVDAIRGTYPQAGIVRQRQVTRERPSSAQLRSVLSDDLTERQRVALETGYFGGFFDWPRLRSGEEVADSLGIGASTYHQHVRKAEKKLLDVVFAED